MAWFLWALCASLCAAALAESNRIFKLDPQYLNAWRASFAALLVGLAFPYMEWPTSPSFYIVALCDGVVTGIGMVLFFYLAAKRTGRVSSMILPLAAVGSYLTWWLLHPTERPDIFETPAQAFLAVVSATTVMVCLQRIRNNDTSWESFLLVLPVGLAFGLMDALIKDVIGRDYHLYGIVLSFSFVALAACALSAWIATIPKPAGGRSMALSDPKLLWGSFWCAFWTAGMVLSGVFALTLAPHPTLPGLLMAMTPVWLLFLNLLRHTDDDVSVVASMILILGALGLLLSTL